MAKHGTQKQPKITSQQVADVESAVFSCAEAVLPQEFYLLDVGFEQEAGHWYLRLYIEGRGTRVSLNDCEAVSRTLDEKISQAVEALPGLAVLPYSLEVSSPGAFRALSKPREFAFYQGAPVRVQGAPGSKRPFPPVEGILLGYDADTQALTLQVSDVQEVIKLNADRAVYLNPELKFPEEDSSSSVS